MPSTQPSDPLAAERENERRKEIARIIGADAFTAAAEVSSWLDERGVTGWEKLGAMSLYANPLWKVQDAYEKADQLLALPPIPQQGEAVYGDPEMPDCIRPLSWLKEMIEEAKRRGPTEDDEDPDAYWTMISEVQTLHDALAATTPAPPASQALAEPVAWRPALEAALAVLRRKSGDHPPSKEERADISRAIEGVLAAPAEAQARVDGETDEHEHIRSVALRVMKQNKMAGDPEIAILIADALLSGSTPKPAGVVIDDAMVERAALVLQQVRYERLKNLWDTKGASLMTDEPSGMRDDARAALTAALSGDA